MKNLEHVEQALFVKWASMQSNKHPELKMLFAIPNGGHRHVAVAKKLKEEGVKSGVPDLFLAVPSLVNLEIPARDRSHSSFVPVINTPGLFIEMKVGKNKLTKNQEWWIGNLQGQGYRCEVCYSFEEARNVICDYLKIEENSR